MDAHAKIQTHPHIYRKLVSYISRNGNTLYFHILSYMNSIEMRFVNQTSNDLKREVTALALWETLDLNETQKTVRMFFL